MTDNRSVIFRFSSLTEQFNAQISEVAVSVCCHARGINTLSESRSGSAWHSRYRKDFGSLHSVCLVVRKYVPPTFRRTHLDEPLADGSSLSPGERAGDLRALEPLGSGLISAIPPLHSRCLHWWWKFMELSESRKCAEFESRCALPSQSNTPLAVFPNTRCWLSRLHTFDRKERCARSDALEFYLDRQLGKFWHATMIVFVFNC